MPAMGSPWERLPPKKRIHSLTEKLANLARHIQRQPWNACGEDKTWVLEALHQYQLFQQEIREAQRVRSDS